jgi:4-amino-4-deoxychorismate lyase
MSLSLVNGLTSDQLNIADRGLSYGDGVFETIQIRAGKALLWGAHLERLERGANRLKIPFDQQLKEAFVEDLSVLLNVADATLKQQSVLKLTLTRGIGKRGYKADPNAKPTRVTSLSTMPDMLEKQQQGIDVIICQTRLARQPLLAGIKHLNRLEQVLARSEWDNEQITEGLVCDTQGNVIEGCMSNLFWVKSGVLYTPDLTYSGVAGIVRDTIIDLCKAQKLMTIEQGDYNLQHLLDAEQVFICNSVFNILPIVRICSACNTQTLAIFDIGTHTKILQKSLQQYYLKEA